MTAVTTTPDPALLEQKMGIGYGAFGGLLNAAMMSLGAELGIYKSMAGTGEFTTEDLAAKTGLAERFLREWVHAQAAVGVIENRGDGRFELTPESALIFADSSYPLSLAEGLRHLPTIFRQALESADALKSGAGKPYDGFGESGARMIDACLGAWNRTSLVSEALPRIPGVTERLEQGAAVADVGCGAGAAIIAVAQAFPKADVHGYDNSRHALAVAAENVGAAGVSNVEIHNPDQDPLPEEPTFDLMMTLDCLHDMTRPDLVAAGIRRAIKPDGVWLIVDVDAGTNLEENIAHPFGPMLFAMSLTMCLQSSVGDGSGMGLGPMGLPEPKMRELATGAGFTRFSRVDGLSHPSNAFYEVRP